MTRKYYSGIRRNNEAIYARSSVLLKSGPCRKDLPFVARVSGFWEEVEGNRGELRTVFKLRNVFMVGYHNVKILAHTRHVGY